MLYRFFSTIINLTQLFFYNLAKFMNVKYNTISIAVLYLFTIIFDEAFELPFVKQRIIKYSCQFLRLLYNKQYM